MKAHSHTEDTPVWRRRLAQAKDHQKAQRPAEPRRPALARTCTDRLKRQMLGMDRAGQPCACDDKTPCLAHASITEGAVMSDRHEPQEVDTLAPIQSEDHVQPIGAPTLEAAARYLNVDRTADPDRSP